MKILVVAPIVAEESSFLYKEIHDVYETLTKDSKTEVSVAFLKNGPPCIMNAEQELQALPDVIRIIKENKDSDAVIIDCMADPGIGVAREVSNTLIVGPLLSSLAFASTLGHKVSIITVTASVLPMLMERVTVYGYANRVASIRFVDIGVLELGDKEKLFGRLFECSQQAITQDGANVIILGCTGMLGVASDLQEKLKVPVVDPTESALRFAESLVSMKLSHSKLITRCKP